MAAQAWVQIASVDTHDSSACVILGTRHERFMFNVGEGTQRSSMEHGIRVSKLEHVFLTHLSSDTLGGLPGLLLTLADVRNNNLNVHDGIIKSGSGPEGSSAAAKAAKGGRQAVTAARSPEGAAITLHGPPGLAEFYRATWHFIRREDFHVVVDAVTDGANKKFRHEELDVIPIPVFFVADGEPKPPGATTSGEPSPVTPPVDGKEAEELPPATKRVKREGTGRGSGGSAGPGEGGRRVGCVCYVCEVPPLPGKFDVKKAVALGVPMGPEFGKLQKGHDVKLEDGTVIKPSQVLGPPRLGSRAIIVACPSVELLPSLVSHPDWERFYTDDVGGNGGGARGGGGNGDNEKPSHPPCIVHLAPEGVLRSREYGEWARRFGSGATHIVTTRPFCPQHSIFQAGHDQAARLNRVCGAAFALPKQFADDLADDAATNRDTGLSEPRLIAPEELDFGGKVVSGVPLMKFELLQTSKRPQLDTSEALTWERSRAISKSMLRSLKAPRIFPSPSRHAGLAELASSSGGAGAAASNAPAGAFAAAATPDSEVVFFGTGSAMPSKYRNVTGMLVRLIAGEHAGAGANGIQTTAAPGSVAAPSDGSGDAGIMLDAGEGTMGQMWRIFGDGSDDSRSGSNSGENSGSSSGGGGGGGGTQQILRNLAAVWISHPHADHHLGLVRILSERNKLLGFDGRVGGGGGGGSGDTAAKGDLSKVKGAAGAGVATFPKLLLMAPAPVATWLKEYGDIDPTVRGGYDFLDASHMLAGDTAPRPPPHVATAARQALARAGVLRATSVRVQHCAHAYALVLTVAASAAAKAASKATSKASAAKAESNTGGAGVAMQGIRGTGKDWKLVYSGDCRPSEALVREGKGAAVLIHEATFDESKQQEAYAKAHSTIPEALGVGQRMCAEQVILTHFSQRYPHMPTGIVGTVGSNVCLAFDFMRVRLSDLSWLSRRSAALAAAVTPDAAPSTSPQEVRRSRKTPPEKKQTVAPSSRRLPPSPSLAGGPSPISWAAATAAAPESGVGGSGGGVGSTSSIRGNSSECRR